MTIFRGKDPLMWRLQRGEIGFLSHDAAIYFSVMIMAYALLSSLDMFESSYYFQLSQFTWPVLIFPILWGSFHATYRTANICGDPAYEILKLTPYTDHELLMTYLRVTVRRMRLYLFVSLIAALLAMLALVGLVSLNNECVRYQTPSPTLHNSPPNLLCIRNVPMQLYFGEVEVHSGRASLVIGGLIVMAYGLIWLGMAGGVMAGMIWPLPTLTPVVMLISMMVLTSLLWYGAAWLPLPLDPVRVGVWIAFAILPYVTTIGMVIMGARFAR